MGEGVSKREGGRSLAYPFTDRHDNDAGRFHRVLRRKKYPTVVPSSLVVSARRAPDCKVPFKQVFLHTGRQRVWLPEMYVSQQTSRG